MLQIGQAVSQIGEVVIIDHGHDRRDFFPLLGPLLLDQRIPHQVTDRLGAVGISAFLDKLVKTGEELGLTV